MRGAGDTGGYNFFGLNQQMRKQLFISHSWGRRHTTHEYVVQVENALTCRGWSCWLDENDMGGKLDESMVLGIENCDAALIFLTRDYCEKIRKGGSDANNCFKEWTLLHAHKTCCIPVVLDTTIKDMTNWPGVVRMNLGSRVFVDCSSLHPDGAAEKLHTKLYSDGLRPMVDCAAPANESIPCTPGAPRSLIKLHTHQASAQRLPPLTGGEQRSLRLCLQFKANHMAGPRMVKEAMESLIQDNDCQDASVKVRIEVMKDY